MTSNILKAFMVAMGLALVSACGSDSGGLGGGDESANGPTMRPGENCNSCHNFSVAGTVFADPAASSDSGVSNAIVRLTDAKGVKVDLQTNSAGNFYSSKSLSFPLKAEIINNGTTKEMSSKVTTGGCASCHSSPGQNSAPGRLYTE